MKTLSFYGKLMLAFVIWTFCFLSLASYSAKRTYQADPELLQKMAKKYNFDLNINGLSVQRTAGGNPGVDELTDLWKENLPAEQILITSFNGDVIIQQSQADQIVVKASGRLDDSRAPRLLEVENDGQRLIIKQPAEGATKNLRMTIEIPKQYSHHLTALTASGDLHLENLGLRTLDLKSVSGDVRIEKVTAEKLFFKSVSGGLNVTNSSVLQVNGQSMSGDLELSSEIPTNYEINSVSGDIRLKIFETKNVKYSLRSISGEIENLHGSDPRGKLKVDIKTVSGDIHVE